MYEKQDWSDVYGETPFNADRMKHIEEGIYENSKNIDENINNVYEYNGELKDITANANSWTSLYEDVTTDTLPMGVYLFILNISLIGETGASTIRPTLNGYEINAGKRMTIPTLTSKETAGAYTAIVNVTTPQKYTLNCHIYPSTPTRAARTNFYTFIKIK